MIIRFKAPNGTGPLVNTCINVAMTEETKSLVLAHTQQKRMSMSVWIRRLIERELRCG